MLNFLHSEVVLQHIMLKLQDHFRLEKTARFCFPSFLINCPISLKRSLRLMQDKSNKEFIFIKLKNMTQIDFAGLWRSELKTCENLSRTSFYPSLNTVLQGVMNSEKQLAFLALRRTGTFIVRLCAVCQ